MANNYLQFSATMFEELTPEECEWLEEALWFDDVEKAAKFLGQEIDNEDWPAFQWKILVEPSDATGKSVQHLFWVYSDEYGSVENIAVLCQAFIRKFRPDSVVGLTWAAYCSKLRVGEFSGGWMVVSRDEQRFGNCDDELEKATKEMLNEPENRREELA